MLIDTFPHSHLYFTIYLCYTISLWIWPVLVTFYLYYSKETDKVRPIDCEAVTISLSTNSVVIIITVVLCSHIILQKSVTVNARGPCVAM